MQNAILEILCCPITRRGLMRMPADELNRLNKAITAGKVKNQANLLLEMPLTEALVTTDGELVYPVRDGIPVLLADECINWSVYRDSVIG
jgi:uncharacterized protein YbaR (Trm112 family)